MGALKLRDIAKSAAAGLVVAGSILGPMTVAAHAEKPVNDTSASTSNINMFDNVFYEAHDQSTKKGWENVVVMAVALAKNPKHHLSK